MGVTEHVKKKQDGWFFFFDHLPMSVPPFCLVKSYGFHGNILTFSTSDFPVKIMGLSTNPEETAWGFQTCFIFHFIYGMSSFPLTDIFSRWLKPPTSKPIQSIESRSRTSDSRSHWRDANAPILDPLWTLCTFVDGRRVDEHGIWDIDMAMNREKHDDFIGI